MVSVFSHGKRLNKTSAVLTWLLSTILGTWSVGGRENNLVLSLAAHSTIPRCGVCQRRSEKSRAHGETGEKRLHHCLEGCFGDEECVETNCGCEVKTKGQLRMI
jgi:hypothetical protein